MYASERKQYSNNVRRKIDIYHQSDPPSVTDTYE